MNTQPMETIGEFLKILESDESFEAWLVKASKDPELQAYFDRVEAGLDHISTEDLQAYANDTLDEPLWERVSDHLIECRKCSRTYLDMKYPSD